jgi:hypothetical protein
MRRNRCGEAAVKAIVISVAAAIIGAAIIGAFTLYDPLGLQEGHLSEVDTAKYEAPPGPNSPTWVNFRNDGRKPLQIQKVYLSDLRKFRTPPRQNLVSAGPPIYLTFRPNNYIENGGYYALVLREPREIGPGEWNSLVVSLVDPRMVGWTILATLTVEYNGNLKQIYYVQLDVLPQDA